MTHSTSALLALVLLATACTPPQPPGYAPTATLADRPGYLPAYPPYGDATRQWQHYWHTWRSAP